MRKWILAFGVAALQVLSSAAQAQAQLTPEDKAAASAQRKAQGAEAAREFQPGEGNPIPEARPKVSKSERAAARAARKPVGAQAAREFQPGEGNPIPEAKPKVPSTDRKSANAARRAEMGRANKAGEIPSYHDSGDSK
jgi:hypothetical protein